jgi:hypothetical protein
MKFKPGDMLPTTVMEAVTGEAISRLVPGQDAKDDRQRSLASDDSR